MSRFHFQTQRYCFKNHTIQLLNTGCRLHLFLAHGQDHRRKARKSEGKLLNSGSMYPMYSDLHHWKCGPLVKVANLTCVFCHSNDFWQIWDSILRNTHLIPHSCPVQTQTSRTGWMQHCDGYYRASVMTWSHSATPVCSHIIHYCSMWAQFLPTPNCSYGLCISQHVCANVEFRISLARKNTDTKALSCLKTQCKYEKAICCNRKWPFNV